LCGVAGGVSPVARFCGAAGGISPVGRFCAAAGDFSPPEGFCCAVDGVSPAERFCGAAPGGRVTSPTEPSYPRRRRWQASPAKFAELAILGGFSAPAGHASVTQCVRKAGEETKSRREGGNLKPLPTRLPPRRAPERRILCPPQERRVALHLGEGSIGRLADPIVERGASQPLLRQPNPSVGLDQPRGLAQRLAGKHTFSSSREDAGAPVKALPGRWRDGE